MSKNNDLRATIKTLIENVQLGNKSGTEVASSLNLWLKEGGEALKQEVAALKKGTPNGSAQQSAKKTSTKKSSAKKSPVKKMAKKSAKKAVAKKAAKKVSK